MYYHITVLSRYVDMRREEATGKATVVSNQICLPAGQTHLETPSQWNLTQPVMERALRESLGALLMAGGNGARLRTPRMSESHGPTKRGPGEFRRRVEGGFSKVRDESTELAE
jgi:hypothetical protein